MVTTTPKNYESVTDLELAEATREGDDAAFQALVIRYTDHIWNFARQYTRNDEDTEDIVQDSFFKAWKNIAKYEKGRAFRPWLFTITRNTALDHIKKKKAMVFSELDNTEDDLSFADTLHDTEPLPPEVFEMARYSEELTKALDTLHPDHRAVLVMHYHQEMTFDEIAIILKKPMNTVKSWHRRALTKIRSFFPARGGIKNL